MGEPQLRFLTMDGQGKGAQTPPPCPAPHSPADTKATLPKDNP